MNDEKCTPENPCGKLKYWGVCGHEHESSKAVQPVCDARELAELFHTTYERLAPTFGYDTRKSSAVPWNQVPEQNRKLMIEVCEEVLAHLRSADAQRETRNNQLNCEAIARWKERAERAEAEVARLKQENAAAWQVVKDACDRDWENETPFQIASIASNAIFWRNEEIRRLRAKRDADVSAKVRKAMDEIHEMYRKTSLRGLYCTTPTQQEAGVAIILRALTE